MRDWTSTYFCNEDIHVKNFIFDLDPTWWSRPYEYPWASQFVESNDIVLDAACGICHPLKFYLSDYAREVYACDIDPRILQPEKILEEIEVVFGKNARMELPSKYLNKIHFSQASLLSLPYPDKKFDRIICISVIEHLNDIFNKYPIFWSVRKILSHSKKEIYSALFEFRRTLKG